MADQPVNDVTVNSYVCQLQRRHEQFQREQRVGADAFGQFIHDTFFMRDKNSFDALLRAMLTPPERDRLQTDPTFTQAWQIFVDFCWLQKRFRQFGIIAGAILLCLAIIAFGVWAFPHLIHSSPR